MQAEDALVYYCGHGQPFEDLVDRVEYRVVALEWVFTQTGAALVCESEVVIDVLVFMVAAQHVDGLGLLALECKQEAHGFETVRASVHVVAEEELVVAVDVSRLQFVAGAALEVEEAHQVTLLPVDVSEDFNGRFDVEHDRSLLEGFFGLLTEFEDQFGAEVEGVVHVGFPVGGPQQLLDE